MRPRFKARSSSAEVTIEHPLFLIYGVLLLGLTGVAEYQGWSWTA